MKNIGIKIKEIRKGKGVTQEELAELSNMNLRTIQRIENSETSPRGNSLTAICEALQVDMETIIPEENQTRENRIAKIIAEVVLLIALNIAILSLFGFLTLDTEANRNSRLGAYLLSIFIPLVILFFTPAMNPYVRVIKFGSGLFFYMILALILLSIPEPIAIMKGLIPSILVFLAILCFGNELLRKVKN